MSDGTFTKYVRPVSLAITLLVFFVIMILDGNFRDFTVQDAYLVILGSTLSVMIVFYFSSRGAEKVTKTIVSYKESQILREERMQHKRRSQNGAEIIKDYPGHPDHPNDSEIAKFRNKYNGS